MHPLDLLHHLHASYTKKRLLMSSTVFSTVRSPYSHSKTFYTLVWHSRSSLVYFCAVGSLSRRPSGPGSHRGILYLSPEPQNSQGHQQCYQHPCRRSPTCSVSGTHAAWNSWLRQWRLRQAALPLKPEEVHGEGQGFPSEALYCSR